MLHEFPRLAAPEWTNLKDFNTLTADAKSEVKFWPDVWSRTVLLYESTDDLLQTLGFKFAYGHDS